jgi:hypothetical protein
MTAEAGRLDLRGLFELEVRRRVFLSAFDRVLQGYGARSGSIVRSDDVWGDAALYVRLDKSGEVLGCGRDAIVGVPGPQP